MKSILSKKLLLNVFFIVGVLVALLYFPQKSLAYVDCGQGYTCYNPQWTACQDPSIGSCGWQWGTQYDAGYCLGGPNNGQACYTTSQSCCMPGQNNCPCNGSTCTDNYNECVVNEHLDYTGPCDLGSYCTGNPSGQCHYCQTPQGPQCEPDHGTCLAWGSSCGNWDDGYECQSGYRCCTQMVTPTPTYPPYPTDTPPPGSTPTPTVPPSATPRASRTPTPRPNPSWTPTPIPTATPGTYRISGRYINIGLSPTPAICANAVGTSYNLNSYQVNLYPDNRETFTENYPIATPPNPGAFLFYNTPNGVHSLDGEIPTGLQYVCSYSPTNGSTFGPRPTVTVNGGNVSGIKYVFKEPPPPPCNLPTYLNNVQPSSPPSISPGVRNITWSTDGLTYYIRIDDMSTPWDPYIVCDGLPHNGDYCLNNIPGTSYAFNFLANKNYHIWVHPGNECGPNWNVVGQSYVNVLGPTPTNTPTPIIPPTATNTPTPTPTQMPWIKLKNSSLQTRNAISSRVPNFPAQFIPGDIDDPVPVVPFFDAEDTSNGRIDAGVISAFRLDYPPLNQLSRPQWLAANYSFNVQFGSPQSFFSYVRARKQYKDISSLPGCLFNITSANGVLYYYNPVSPTCSQRHIQQPPVPPNSVPQVLIVPGDFYIDDDGSNTFNVNNVGDVPQVPFAVITDRLHFANTLQKAYGIFIAGTVDTGVNPDRGLKIKGSLITSTNLFTQMGRGRSSSNNNAPALFIVQYPKTYIELLPYLSTATYDWKELNVTVPTPTPQGNFGQ